MTGNWWVEYAEAAQRLAEVRRGEERRLATGQERAAGMRAAADQLRRRLDAQRAHLLNVARTLRLAEPSFGEAGRGGLTDADEAARAAWEAVKEADRAATEAANRGHQAGFLPGVPPTLRNAAVYAGTTALLAVVSVGLVLFGARSQDRQIPTWTMPWSLCGLPAVAFFAGYFIIVNFAHPRVADEPVGTAPQSGRGRRTGRPKRTASVRLGGLICLLGMWLAWAVAVSVNLS
ncbi:MAG: hypothetical protein V7603_3975 [Micromonosporaceae bacterium]